MIRQQNTPAILMCGLAAMLATPPADAQNAIEILSRTAETYRNIRTWDIQQTVVVETPGAPASRTERRERYAAVEGKHRWEQDARMSVADGKYEWTYSSLTNRYSRRVQEPVGGGPLPMGYWIPDAEKVKRARLVREDSVTVDGLAVASYVVEIEHDFADRTPETLWIDKSRYLVLKRERRTPPLYIMQRIWTTTLSKVSINEPVPDAVFEFVPPPGAKLEEPPSPAPKTAPPAKSKRKKK
jgi:outer membrane lipoprotein-sorting protein